MVLRSSKICIGPSLSSATSTQRILTYFVRESKTCSDSAVLVTSNQQQIYMFGRIQTSQTGGKLYNDALPYKVSEYSLVKVMLLSSR